jgi:hypothetical protein
MTRPASVDHPPREPLADADHIAGPRAPAALDRAPEFDDARQAVLAVLPATVHYAD